MNIGEVIKKYRKLKNMTQEEMANRLGVSAPAVNKWENGNSMPDIMLLAPIARLLDISLDTLLSFQGEITDKEVNELVKEANRRLETEDYEEVFQWAKKQMEKYPNSEHLLLWMALGLEANRVIREVPEADKYDDFLKNTFVRLLESHEEYVKTSAADALYGFFLRKEQYEKAEKYLQYFSMENPERKRKQAFLYEKAGRTEDAYKAYEEIICAEYQILNMTFYSIFNMSLKENNLEKAELLVEKKKLLRRAFEMGEYHDYVMELELVQKKKDVEKTLECAKHILSGIEKLDAQKESKLYEHMVFKMITDEFKVKLRQSLLKLFKEEKEFGYMKGNEHWERLLIEEAASSAGTLD